MNKPLVPPFAKEVEADLLKDPKYNALKNHVMKVTGLTYYEGKDAEFCDRLKRRFKTLGITDCSTYLNLLNNPQSGEAELDGLVLELTIGETYFNRHKEQLDSLCDIVIPRIIEKNQNTRKIRIWCAGCSIGAEPYSIAILLQQKFMAQIPGWDVNIKATDINKEFLAKAKEGRYEEWSFRGTDSEFRRQYFSPLGKSWIINPEIKRLVTFQYHNLLKHPYPSLIDGLAVLDLIICRNVMIYFNQETIKQVLLHFEQSLAVGGWLVLGHAELTFGVPGDFKMVQTPSTLLFQKGRNSEHPSLPTIPLAMAGLEFSPESVLEKLPPAPLDHYTRPEEVPEVKPLERPEIQKAQVPTLENDIKEIRTLADRGEFEKAIRACQRLLEREKLNPLVYFYYALMLAQVGRNTETEKALRQAIYLDRNFILAHYYLGTLLQRQGDMGKAVTHYKNAQSLLTSMSDATTFPEWDDISVKELKKLIQMHLEGL